jgi:hypothetical protein
VDGITAIGSKHFADSFQNHRVSGWSLQIAFKDRSGLADEYMSSVQGPLCARREGLMHGRNGMGVVERNPQRQVSPQNGSMVMKKALSVSLIILCVGVFAFGYADARPGKPPKPPGPKPEQVNGVSRINASGDIRGAVELSTELASCPTDESTFKILVYVAGQSIVARPALNEQTGNYDFVLYNVPVPVEGTVDVTAELFDAATGLFSISSAPVPLAKHAVTNLEDPIVVKCQPAPTPTP